MDLAKELVSTLEKLVTGSYKNPGAKNSIKKENSVLAKKEIETVSLSEIKSYIKGLEENPTVIPGQIVDQLLS